MSRALERNNVSLDGFNAAVQWWDSQGVNTLALATARLRELARTHQQRTGILTPAPDNQGYIQPAFQEYLMTLADPAGALQNSIMLDGRGMYQPEAAVATGSDGWITGRGRAGADSDATQGADSDRHPRLGCIQGAGNGPHSSNRMPQQALPGVAATNRYRRFANSRQVNMTWRL